MKSDVYARLIPHLKDRVFSTTIRKVDAGEVRGNTPLQDKIQSEAMVEVDRLFKDLGVMVRAVSLSWATNDQERAEIERSKVTREQEMLDFQTERAKRDLTRERETKEFTLKGDFDAEKLKTMREDELRHLILNQELSFVDAQKEGTRVQELKTLGHELELLSIKRTDSYRKALEDAQNETERAAIRKKLREIELDTKAMEDAQRLRLAEAEEIQRIRLKEADENSKLNIAERARADQIKAMQAMGAIEHEAAKADWEIERDKKLLEQEGALKTKELDHAAEVNRLQAHKDLTPDQILAAAAGQSADVARVFAERAKVQGADVDKREALLREMVQMSKEGQQASSDQAKYFIDKASQTVQGVAGARQAEPAKSDDTAECPKCHRRVPITDRFCRFCGQTMRS
jgi:hypothetical protein